MIMNVRFPITISMLALLGAAGACDRAPDESDAPPPPALGLSGGAEDLEALGRLVVEAVGRTDTAALEALRLTEHEHNDLVFPRLPAGQPPQNFPVDIAWANIRTRNSVAVLKLFERFGDRRLEFEAVECLGEPERFEGFEVVTDCWTEFSDPDGNRHRVQLFRHALSADGRYKIFRYYN